MLIVGESINGTIERVGAAIAGRDDGFIRRLARQQMERGAQMLDVNAGLGGRDEKEDLAWMVSLVQEEVGLPLVIDSSLPEAIEAALALHQGKGLVNSISAEGKKQERLLPVLAAHDCGVVALCLTDEGIPKTAQGRLAVAQGLVEMLTKAGKAEADIYLDPLILTIATDWQAGAIALETLHLFKRELPQVKTMAGLSNVGFGMPQRRLLNRTFLAMAVALGLDGVILDVRDGSLLATLYAAQALAGRDKWCREYLRAYREGRLRE